MAGLETLGRYEIVAELGRGAMGTVYEAVDSKFDRLVALKTVRLDPTAPDYAEFRERFRAEAKSAGRLSHPNIVIIHDFGEAEDTAYIAMEFLRGETLRAMLDRQRFSIRRAVRYALQLADGLAAAHAAGVVHRDIKPANVLRLRSGLLKITDFGIAQLPASQLTQDGTFLGTPKYMSPEQGLGLRVDGRSDIFSLGVLLYEMLTGTLPFGGSSLSSLMSQVVYEQPIHPKCWNPALPDGLVQIVARCLAKNPDVRYQSAVELGQDLGQYKDLDLDAGADLMNVFLPQDPEHVQSGSASVAPPGQPLEQVNVPDRPSHEQWQSTLRLSPVANSTPTRARSVSDISLTKHPGWAIGCTLAAALCIATGLYLFDRNPTPAANADATPRGPVAFSPRTVVPSVAVSPSVQAIERASSSAPQKAPSLAGPSEGPADLAPQPQTFAARIRKAKKKNMHRLTPVASVILSERPSAPLPPTPAPVAPLLRPTPVPMAPQTSAREAALLRDLQKQRDCIVLNRCD